MKFRRFALLSVSVGLIAATVSGCSHSGGLATSQSNVTAQNSQWSGYEAAVNYAAQHGTVVTQVTYQPNAVVFDEQSTERALKDISADGSVYTLDATSPEAGRLKSGSVLFLYGIAIRKVTAVQLQGTTMAVTTSDADITDLIKQGHIAWQVPIDFSIIDAAYPPTDQSTSSLENLIASPALADEPTFMFEGAAGPVDYELGFTRVPNRINLELKAKLSKWGELWQADGEGYMETVTDMGEIDVDKGQVARLEMAVTSAHTHIDFNWTAQTQVAGPAALFDQSFKVKIPGASAEFPIIMGGIPFVIEFSAALIIHPAFTAKNEITTGKFSIDYSGKEGFNYTSGAPEPEGKVTGNEEIDHSTSVFGIAALGFVAALEMPRLEMALATMSLSNMREARELPSLHEKALGTGYVVGSPSEHITLRKVITTNLSHFIEEVAIPVRPYGYADFVTSTGTFTNGAMMTGLIPVPPCQRAQITLSANVGAGVKLTFAHHLPLPTVLGHTASVEAGEFAVTAPIMKRTFIRYKNGIKCPGD